MLALVFLLFSAALAGPMLGAGKGPGKSKRPFDVKEILAGNYTVLAWKGLRAPEGIPLTGQLTLGEGEENMTASGALERVRVTEVAGEGANASEAVREVLESTPFRVLVHNATSVSLERDGRPFCDLDFEVNETQGRYVAAGKTADGRDFVFAIHSGLSFTLALRDPQEGAVLYEITKTRQVQPQSMKSRIVSSLMMMVPMFASQWMMRKQMANMNQAPQQPAPEGTDVPVGQRRRQEASESTESGAAGAEGAAAADTAGEQRE